MNNDLDLLDLDDGMPLDDGLPVNTPFANHPRPKKPFLLVSVGIAVIVLASYIIISTLGDSASSTMEVNLDAPEIVVDGADEVSLDSVVADVAAEPVVVEKNIVVPVKPVAPAKPAVAKTAPKPVAVVGSPVRVIEDRKEVVFQPAAQPKAAPKAAAKPVVKKVAPKPVVAPKGDWYVQFGSYSTRALAESAQRQMLSKNAALFANKQFVILAAVLKNGTTTYRLRIPFVNSGDANSFCKTAKGQSVDCYVAK